MKLKRKAETEGCDMRIRQYVCSGVVVVMLSVFTPTTPGVNDNLVGFWDLIRDVSSFTRLTSQGSWEHHASREQRFEHRVRPGETLWGIAGQYGETVQAIKERNAIDDADLIRTGQTLVIISGPAIAKVRASWYGDFFHGRPMANGVPFDKHDPSVVAHKTLPLGTRLLVRNPETKSTLEVVVQDRGPYIRGRELDFSEAAAEKLGFKNNGVAVIEYVILETPTS